MYAAVCRRLADAEAVRRVAPDDRWDIPLRLLAGLHYLALRDGIDPWSDPAQVMEDHAAFLRRFAAEQAIQTNEVQRSWLLLPCFLELARRAGVDTLDLVELGPSAGLNLVWDRYGYAYGEGAWGPPGALLVLEGKERRPVPGSLLEQQLLVRDRVGIDRRPLDVSDDAGGRLLASFVWADQHHRLERLARAIEAVRQEPPELVQGDLVERLPDVLARRRRGALTVVFGTAVLGYLDARDRARVYDALDAAAAEAPLALVQTGQPPDGADDHWGLWIRLWPDTREVVGLANFHGAWLDWLA